MKAFEMGAPSTEPVIYPSAPSTAWEVHTYKKGEKPGELGDVAFEYLIKVREGGEVRTKHYVYYWKDEGGIYESPAEYTLDLSQTDVDQQDGASDNFESRTSPDKNYTDLDEALKDLYPIALPGDRVRTRSSLPDAHGFTRVAWIGKDRETGEQKIFEADEPVPDGGSYTVPRRGTFMWKDGRWKPAVATRAEAEVEDQHFKVVPAGDLRSGVDTGPIPGSVDVSADAGAGGGGGETITPTEHVRVLAELKDAKDRELVLQREAVRKQHEYEAIVRALALKSPEAALTLKTAHDAFPIVPNPTTDAERAQNAKHEKMFAAIAERRFKIFQDGERVTDNTENIKRIGEAVLNFQKQPWYVRWGLSGIMAARDSALGAGVATLGSLAWFGTLAVPIATPLITGVAVGAGVRKFFHHSLETDNAIGRGKWFFHKYPHATSAILGALWAPQGFMAGLPGGSVLGTFLEQLSNTAGASLKSLLSLIGFSALGKKAALASPIAL